MALSRAKRFPRPKKTPALHANRSIYCCVSPPLWLKGFDDLPVWYIPRLPWTLPFVKSEISLRKHPFLLALRRWDVSRVSPRETSPAAKSEEKRMFSLAIPQRDDHRQEPMPQTRTQSLFKCFLGWEKIARYFSFFPSHETPRAPQLNPQSSLTPKNTWIATGLESGTTRSFENNIP